MKTKLQMLFASCLGVVVGFTACRFWCVEGSDDDEGVRTSLLTSFVPIVSTQTSVSHAGNLNPTWPQSELLKERQFVTPGWRVPRDWKITLWHPTYPPQAAGIIDIGEYVGRTMLTNR